MCEGVTDHTGDCLVEFFMSQIPEVSGSVRRTSGQLYLPWEGSLLNQYGCGPACQSRCRQSLLTVAATKRVAHSGTCVISQGASFPRCFPLPPTPRSQSPRAPSTHHIHTPYQMALLRRQDISVTWIDDQSPTLLTKYLGNWSHQLDRVYVNSTYTSASNPGASLSFAFTGK